MVSIDSMAKAPNQAARKAGSQAPVPHGGEREARKPRHRHRL
jgi:hypothetical protein